MKILLFFLNGPKRLLNGSHVTIVDMHCIRKQKHMLIGAVVFDCHSPVALDIEQKKKHIIHALNDFQRAAIIAVCTHINDPLAVELQSAFIDLLKSVEAADNRGIQHYIVESQATADYKIIRRTSAESQPVRETGQIANPYLDPFEKV